MIRYTTSVENNLFYARFNLSPQDVKAYRSNYTAIHRGSGTTSRQGIWEGVELHRVYGRVNSSNPWVDLGTNATPALHTHQNGDTIQLKAIYRIKTMGYHWQCTNGSLPFFYYGNIGGNANKYVHGYFTDGSPAAPSNSLHSIHAIVPVDWKHISTQWSDWAYKHGQSTKHWAIERVDMNNVMLTLNQLLVAMDGYLILDTDKLGERVVYLYLKKSSLLM